MSEEIIIPLAIFLGIIVLLPGTIILAVTSVMLLTILLSIGFGGPVVIVQELKKRLRLWTHRRHDL